MKKCTFISIVIFYSIFGAINGSQTISDGIRDWIIDMQRCMPCGFPDREIPVPPLAPFLQASHEFNIDLSNMGGTGTLLNIRVDGLNSFNVIRTDFTMVFLTITYEFVFSSITAQAQFSNVNYRILDNCFINGAGNLWIRANNVRHFGTAVLTTLGGTDGFLSMSQFNSNVDIGSFESNIQSFTGTAAHSDACNRLVEQEFPRIVREEHQWVNDWIASLIIPRSNENLNTMTLSDLLNMVVDPPVRHCAC